MTKQDILIKNGTFNQNHTRVMGQRFIKDAFFDPKDLVQVKYEMLRTARESERNISEIADAYGFSRSAFYKIKTSFEQEGISALLPDKSGPKRARKLTGEHQRFIDKYLVNHPSISSGDLTGILKKERGLEINKRTVERYRSRIGKHY